jgi:8-oxo-dGTP diphosphatase
MSELLPFFKSAFSVDNVVFGFGNGELKVLVVQRGTDPFRGKMALPGDMVFPNEDLDTAAQRILEQLTGLPEVYLEQVRTFGAVNRHPVGRVITVAYYSLIKVDSYQIEASSWAQKATWKNLHEVGKLAFDHNEILSACLSRLKKRVRHAPVGFELLPPKFTLSELQQLYEVILNMELDKRNFRKKMLATELLIDLGETQAAVSHRPARLYSFARDRYFQLAAEGYIFDV